MQKKRRKDGGDIIYENATLYFIPKILTTVVYSSLMTLLHLVFNHLIFKKGHYYNNTLITLLLLFSF